MKPMKRSRILKEIKETARGLDRIATRMSQAVFAAVLNTSTSTVQKWEIGAKRPSGPSLKLLNVIHSKGVDVLS
jgi:putative transcriptional regulator